VFGGEQVHRKKGDVKVILPYTNIGRLARKSEVVTMARREQGKKRNTQSRTKYGGEMNVAIEGRVEKKTP